jgi:hydrogenase nickel incorporation protein HypA/HybF
VAVEFLRGVPDDVTVGGHVMALSCPVGLADRLESSLAPRRIRFRPEAFPSTVIRATLPRRHRGAAMHELAITQGIVEMIVERTDSARVTAVYLRIGKVSGVVPEAVRFCFDLVAAGSPVEGARLEIDEPPGRARCRSCGCAFAVEGLVVLCPCGSADVEVVGGDELLVRAVEVA